ncbi:MAG TPA: prepilin-type N-terminal cleavage/methylation domain-containing protein [Pyrinomonadaceae bacterium]|jgi:prepilin-type N-terminal cleavage/methylation domain-containing protein
MPKLISELKKSSSSAKGFSLIELMIAMTIVLMMLAILASILASFNYQYRTQRIRLEAINNAQTAADTIIRLIRMAGSRPVNCDSSFQPQALTPSVYLSNQYFGKLRIQADWNSPDCTLAGIDEDVTFSVNNGVLYLDNNAQIPFVNRISAIRFKFFDKNNAVITSPQNQPSLITYIQVEVDAMADDQTLTTITSSASIRK